MNKEMMAYVTSRLVIFSGLTMILPIIVALIYKEPFDNILVFLKVIALILIVFSYSATKKPQDSSFYAKEGLIVTGISWILVSLFGGLPFYLSGATDCFIDAFFEAASGFTTTGASTIPVLEGLSHSILFWRSFTHFIGGMGVLVLVLAMLPDTDKSGIQLMKAEVPGPQFDKLLPKLKTTARTLYGLYTFLTVILVLALVIAGMPVFDSITSAFSTAGTGGFAVHSDSIAYYDSPTIEMILAIGMILFATNFSLFYIAIISRSLSPLKSEELKFFLSFVVVSTLVLFVNISPSYKGSLMALKDSFFTVSTIVSTTGFATVDFDLWNTTSKLVILALMIGGGMAGSTAGGIKASRLLTLGKSAKNAIRRVLSPNRVLTIDYDNKQLESSVASSIKSYLIIYLILQLSLIFIFSFAGYDLETTVSTAISCFNNVGPGMGALGPMENYYMVPGWAKVFLSIFMIAGRLELYPILVMFLPSTWKEI